MLTTQLSSRLRALPSWLVEVLLAIAVGLTSTIFAWLAMGLSVDDMHTRWTWGGPDQVLHYGIFTSAAEVFPFVSNIALGFPTGGNLFFAPLLDPWSAIFVWVSSWFTHSGIAILNWYELLSFLVTGLASYLFFRFIGIRRVPSMLWGVAFAVLPTHFVQLALGHPFIANYWAVPLIGILTVMVALPNHGPFARWAASEPTRRSRFLRRILPIAALALLVGLGQSYYFVFGAIVVGGVWLFSSIASLLERRRLRELLWPTITIVALLLVIVTELATLSLNFDDRYSKYFSGRSIVASEIYGGKITFLLLPWVGTGIPKIASLTSRYQQSSPLAPTSEETSSSVIAIVAVVVAITLMLVLLARGGRWRFVRASIFERILTQRVLYVMIFGGVWTLLFYTLAGLGPVFAAIVSPEIRAWSRISIILYLFAIGALALIIQKLITRRWLKITSAIVFALLVIVDQGIGVSRTFPVGTANDSSVKSFATQVDDELRPGCGVIQLPLKAFPESGPVGEMADYDHFMPYIYSQGNLKWSYGAVLGTKSGDYWDKVQSRSQFVEKASTSGACAIMVNTTAYSDDKNGWYRWVERLVADVTKPEIVSSDGDYILYKLG